MITKFTLVLLLAVLSCSANTVPCAPVANVTTYSGSTDCTNGLFTQSNLNVTYSSNFGSVVVSLLGVNTFAAGNDFSDDFGVTTDPAVVVHRANYWIDLKGEVAKTGDAMDLVYLDNIQSSDVRIYETICKVSFAVDFGQCAPANTLAHISAGSGENVIGSFAPTSHLWFDKQIVLGDASITEFENGFGDSTASPEPVTFLMIGGGLIGMGLIRRRRQS